MGSFTMFSAFQMDTASGFKIRSMVGFLPLCAATIIENELASKVPASFGEDSTVL